MRQLFRKLLGKNRFYKFQLRLYLAFSDIPIFVSFDEKKLHLYQAFSKLYEILDKVACSTNKPDKNLNYYYQLLNSFFFTLIDQQDSLLTLEQNRYPDLKLMYNQLKQDWSKDRSKYKQQLALLKTEATINTPIFSKPVSSFSSLFSAIDQELNKFKNRSNTKAATPQIITPLDDLVSINLEKRVILVDKKQVRFSPQENNMRWTITKMLVRANGQFVEISDLANKIDRTAKEIRSYVSQLNKKLIKKNITEIEIVPSNEGSYRIAIVE